MTPKVFHNLAIMSSNQIIKSMNVATVTKSGKQVVLAVAMQTQKWKRTESVARSQASGFRKSVLESPTTLPAGTVKVVSWLVPFFTWRELRLISLQGQQAFKYCWPERPLFRMLLWWKWQWNIFPPSIGDQRRRDGKGSKSYSGADVWSLYSLLSRNLSSLVGADKAVIGVFMMPTTSNGLVKWDNPTLNRADWRLREENRSLGISHVKNKETSENFSDRNLSTPTALCLRRRFFLRPPCSALCYLKSRSRSCAFPRLVLIFLPHPSLANDFF